MIRKNTIHALSYMPLVAASLVLAGCPFDPPGAEQITDAAPDTDSGGMDDRLNAFRKQIDITPTSGNFTLSGELVNIPVAIILDTDMELTEHAREDGADIVFTAKNNGQLLSHELERFNTDTGGLVAWVRLPSLPRDGTSIYMHYGMPDVVDQRVPSDTWSNDFAGVWHLVRDDISPVVSQFHDSTSNMNDGTAVVISDMGDKTDQRPTQGNGIIGPGLRFDGNNDAIRIPHPVDGSLDFEAHSFSWSLWVLVSSTAGNHDVPWFKGASSVRLDAGYSLELGNGYWVAILSDGTNRISCIFGTKSELDNMLTHLVAVVDRGLGNLILYANGQPKSTCPLQQLGSTSSSDEVRISGNMFKFEGTLDEIRVYSEAITPDRVAFEYHNVTAPGHLMSVGEEESSEYPLPPTQDAEMARPYAESQQ